MTQPNNIDNGSNDATPSDSASLFPFGAADEMVSSILEPADSDVAASSRPPGTTDLSLSEKTRVADLLWIHALLEQALRPQPGQRDSRIHRAMASISTIDAEAASEKAKSVTAQPTPIARPQRRLRMAWIVAAVVLIAVGLWFQATDPSRQARASVERMRRVAAELRDREYQVKLTVNPPQVASHPAKTRQLTGDLFVRGGEAFALRTPAIIGPGHLWMGGNADGMWLKPPLGPIVLEAHPEVLMKRWLQQPIDSRYLQIATVLKRLDDLYDIEMLPDETPRDVLAKVSAPLQHLRGTHRKPGGSLPKTIDVWSDREGGHVIRMVLKWQTESTPGLQSIEFNFVKHAELPKDWYTPEGHSRSRRND